jgi:3-dehydroquinate synthase
MNYPEIFTELRFIGTNLLREVNAYSQCFILCDSNTAIHCLPRLDTIVPHCTIITIPAGEDHKTIDSCQYIWQQLTEAGADRRSLLVNLGGGMVSDIGGFAAACYKRGITCYNIPTTLLAMIDASAGGKTGIDYLGYKNQVGVFSPPQCTWIHTDFLSTLPDRELVAGMAEALKHALIGESKMFYELYALRADWRRLITSDFIQQNVSIKQRITEDDPDEMGIRQVLNLGHTIGHAVESAYLHTAHPLLHGEAVYIGLVVELLLSVQLTRLNIDIVLDTIEIIRAIYTLPAITIPTDELIANMRQDKKSINSQILMSLLRDVGYCSYGIPVSDADIVKAVGEYNKIVAK